MFVSANEVGQVTTDDYLNIRSTPSTKGDIVGKLKAGEQVEIVERSGDWLKIKSKAREGFVYSAYVQVHTTKNTENPSSNKITVYVNGELLPLPIEPPIIDGRVLVPFRGIGETLGIRVNWLADKRQVEAIDPNKKVLFTIGQKKVQVNNESIDLNPAPTIFMNRTVIPLRFFAESYGAEVLWNDKERKVSIVQTMAPESPNEDQTVGDEIRSTILAIIAAEESIAVYTEPSKDSETLGELELGDQVNIYEEPQAEELNQEKWLEIDFNEQLGYIAADSIRPIVETISGKVTSTGLNIREMANVESRTIGQLKKGEEIVIFEFDGNWARFKYNGNWGYVHTYYLDMKQNKKPFTALASPKLENENNRSWLSWDKLGAVTTTHRLIENGVEIEATAPTVDQWIDETHPAINRIEYSTSTKGSKIRIYLNKGYQFVVRHSANTVRITLLNSGLVDKRIVIDAGHGGVDPGAIGVTGLSEKEVNLAVANKLVTLLENAGARVILTRSADTSLTLADRVKRTNDMDADVFVSIHADSFKATSQGSTTFYHSGKNPSWQQSKKLADITIEKITSQLGTVNRGSNDKSLFVIRENEIPAILVEMAFLSNPTEEAMLKTDETRQKAAQAIFDSLVEFYK